MICEPGTRVIAIDRATETTIFIFGYGTYEGNLFHQESGVDKPMIRLDNGRVVWGHECIWGPDDVIEDQFILNRLLVEVNNGA